MARPKGTTRLELEPEIANRIITYIKAGSYLETAAAAAGVNKTTLHRWLNRGAAGEKPFSEFCAQVHTALAEAEIRDLARIDRAADTNWQAAAWKLERRNPKMWGRREYTEVTASSGLPVEYAHMTEAEVDAEIDRLYAELKESRGKHGRLPAKGSSG